MTVRRVTMLLCGLVTVFAGLSIAMKQYALVWWAGCFITALTAAVIVATNRNGRFIPVQALIVVGVGVLMAVVGVIVGAKGLSPRF